MGPLVPLVISEEFSLVIALLIGIAFGFVLEQAGFSSTKKLVGLFYGYDFTVLRVFFTAGITAMAGVLLMGHYGLLDLGIIYINPTFVKSALIGGAIMGAGFIIGGFCPGTSVCALAVGKLDALAFIAGSLIGVFAFAELFPVLENLYAANNLGMVKISTYLGLSDIAFAFMLATMAVGAFVATWLIENKVNRRAPVINFKLRMNYILAASGLFIILGIVAFLPGRYDIINNRITEARRQQTCVFKEISADKLADEIVNNYYAVNIIDVRSPEKFEEFHIPMAINIPFDQIMNRQYEPIFRQRLRTNIFYADSDTLVRMACLKARFIGKSENLILRETAQEFRYMFYELEPPEPGSPKNILDVYNFRNQSAAAMNDLVNSLKNIGAPVKREIVQVRGGC
jgi:rhodanese-related sulfurtransferase